MEARYLMRKRNFAGSVKVTEHSGLAEEEAKA